MDIFDSVVAVFDFIYSILSIIVEGIPGILGLLNNIIDLLISIAKILPSQLYSISVAYFTVFSLVLIFKLLRKG